MIRGWLVLLVLLMPALAHAQQLRPFVGLGVHSRALDGRGAQTLQTAFVPAIEAGITAVLWPSLAIGVSYQSGLGLTITERPPFALENRVSARSQRLAVDIAPSWRLGDTRTRLGFALGLTIRSFWPESHAGLTKGYSLIGPHLRAVLTAALAGPLRVRVAPEVQLLVWFDRDVRSAIGAAVGGELGLELSVRASTVLGLHYRESHALGDVERYLTVRCEEAF